MCKSWEIYALIDPRTMRTRYIGFTTNREKRYKQHFWSAERGQGGHLYNWIRSLLQTGYKPIYHVLEYGTGDGWKECERFWIALYRIFSDLTNLTDGGDGVLGYIYTIETRKKISEGVSKRPPISDETREKLSAARRGKSHSDETREKMSAAKIGIPKSPEHIAKVAEKRRGTHHTEHARAKMSAAHRGKTLSPEHRAKISVALKGRIPWNKGKPTTSLEIPTNEGII